MTKKIKLNLFGLGGNAFALMCAFEKQARREGWADDEIKAVLDKCMAGDYDNLLMTLMNHCEMPKTFPDEFGGDDED